LSGVTVSPVPADEEIMIRFDAAETGQLSLSIIDVLGQEISKETMPINIGLNTKTIDIRSLPVGLYYVTVDNGVDAHTKRIIKQ